MGHSHSGCSVNDSDDGVDDGDNFSQKYSPPSMSSKWSCLNQDDWFLPQP